MYLYLHSIDNDDLTSLQCTTEKDEKDFVSVQQVNTYITAYPHIYTNCIYIYSMLGGILCWHTGYNWVVTYDQDSYFYMHITM